MYAFLYPQRPPRKRRKKVLKAAKGYYGSKHRLFKTAKQAVMKSGQYEMCIRDSLSNVRKSSYGQKEDVLPSGLLSR